METVSEVVVEASSGEAPFWAGLQPPVPADFVWESFEEFIPAISVVLGGVFIFTLIFSFRRSYLDKMILFYLALSVVIHFNLERYYTHHNSEILDPENSHILARMWRHYGVSDTRWLGQQADQPLSQYSCMYGLEWLAAYLCGPTCLLSIILFITKSPWRWTIQAVAVTAQAYGLFITWLPAYYENLDSVPVDNPAMYYGYFIAMQCPWAFIPLLMILQSGYETCKMHKRLLAFEKSKKKL